MTEEETLENKRNKKENIKSQRTPEFIYCNRYNIPNS